MRAWIFSDLHCANFRDLRPAVPAADVAIVAGDLCEGSTRAIGWLADYIRPHMPVVYVLGNHEFYRGSLTGELAVARADAKIRGINLLERNSVSIDEVRFLGTTLWTDYALYSNSEVGRTAYMDAARRGLA